MGGDRGRRLVLADASDARGVAVVVDVLRAFTTAAVALAGGATGIVLCRDVDEAIGLREEGVVDLVMGEVGGARPEGFDLSNSPAEVAAADVRGLRLAQRTTAGTRGVVDASAGARRVVAASFVVATGTARAVTSAVAAGLEACYVVTGAHADLDGDEDAACADLVEQVAAGRRPDPAPYLARVRASTAGRRFGDPRQPQYRPDDLALALDVDRYAFAMPVAAVGGRPWLLPDGRRS